MSSYGGLVNWSEPEKVCNPEVNLRTASSKNRAWCLPTTPALPIVHPDTATAPLMVSSGS